MKLGPFEISREQIAAFCQKWSVEEFSVFGSALRDDFRPDSDVDVLVSLKPGQEMTLEAYLDMRDELSAMFGGREIDLAEKQLIKNPFRRHEILNNREVLYATVTVHGFEGSMATSSLEGRGAMGRR
jgi:predicted nucleotidyltransferase